MSKNIFQAIAMPKIGSNMFDLSHDIKYSFKMGSLVPTTVMEVLPGDRIQISVENMLRFTPLVSPVMHKIDATTHYFFVPYRILWPGWEDFITRTDDATPPYLRDMNDLPEGCLADYMGLPTDAAMSEQERISALPFAAYAKIYDDYYRDQNLQAERFTPLTPGDNTSTYGLIAASAPFSRAWKHDYFTSALPWAQKGDAVTVPLTNSATIPVELKSGSLASTVYKPNFVRTPDGTQADGFIANNPTTSIIEDENGGTKLAYDPDGTLEVDVNEEAVTINSLRVAIVAQRWLEKAARAGSRLKENILAFFGVHTSDGRLQRAEYIGGTKQRMAISEVLATAQTIIGDDVTPLGTMGGHGISLGGGNSFNYYAEEHGIIIGIINVQPDTAYQQGIHRMWSRETALDYAWPEFANLGEQEIKRKEIFANGTVENMNQTFGYIPRYSDYKYVNNRVAGEFRTAYNYWHMGRIFSTQPSLNSAFITANPTTRIFAVETGDHILAHTYVKCRAVRKLPMHGIPGLTTI